MSGPVNYLKFLLTADGKQLRDEVEKSRKTVTDFVDGFAGGLGGLRGVLAGVGGLLATKQILEYGDAWGQISSRVEIATGSIQGGTAAMERLMGMSSRVYKPVADTAELFIRTSNSLEQLGFSSNDALTMVEALSYGLVVSSANGEKTKSVIDAWSKSIMQGKMGLGEFQSVISGAPRLLKAMSDSLGMSERELLKFVASGQMTADKMLLITREVEKLGDEADKMPTTMADAGTRLSNELTGWAGKFNEVTGAGSMVTDSINAVSAAVKASGQVMAENKGIIAGTLGVLAGAGVAAGALAVGSAIMGAGGPVAAIAAVRAAFIGLSAVMAANPAGLLLLGLGAATGLAIAANSMTPRGEKLNKEIAAQEQRLRDAEALLERAGGPKGGMTAKLEARIAGLKTYVEELRAQRDVESGIEAKASDGVAKLTREEVQAAEAAEELAEIRRGLAGVSKDYLPTLEKLNKHYREGRLSEQEYVDIVNDLAKANYKADSSSKAKASAAKAEKTAFDSLIASIRTKREQVSQELQDDEKLTDSQKMRIKLDQDLAQGRLKLSASSQAAVRAELDLLAVEEKRVEARKGKKLTDELLSANAPLAADFADKWKLLSAAYDGTEAGMERLIKAQAVLLAQQPFAQQAAALEQARAEVEQYLAVMERAQAREVASVGMGGRRGEYVAGLNQIEDAYAGRRYDLGRDQQQARVRNGGTLSVELEVYYQQQFALIDEFERKAKASYERTFQAIGEAQANWVNGAQRAFDDYAASATNVAEQTAGLFSRAFSGMEDALVSFAMTGKADFKSMAESIIADLIRIQIRASMVQALGGASGGGGGLFGALVSGVSSLFGSGPSAPATASNYSLTTASNYSGGGLGLTYGGGRERGGSVAAGTMYEVNEGGVPELLNIGQQQFLMMGQQSGSVVPLGNFGGGSVSAGGGWQAGAPIDIDLQIINQGRPAQAEASVERQPDGRAMVKVILREVAADIAGGGEVARGIKQRFSVREI